MRSAGTVLVLSICVCVCVCTVLASDGITPFYAKKKVRTTIFIDFSRFLTRGFSKDSPFQSYDAIYLPL